jgi:hypothetical protein
MAESEGDWFVVRQDEVPGLQHVTKVPHSFLYRQEFPVVCAVLLLRRAQLPGEKVEGLPDILHPLLGDGNYGGSYASVTRASGAVGSG